MPLTAEEKIVRRKASSQKYYLKNRDRLLKECAQRQRDNRERYNGYSRAWAARNAESERARARVKNWKTGGLPNPTRPEPSVCECCGAPNHRALALDHCHKTGKFRGWLCDGCNLGIGRLGDSVEALERALAYLRRAEDDDTNR